MCQNWKTVISRFLCFFPVLLSTFFLCGWGPERDIYTTENPAPYVTFNSISNNPAHGDERNFVQIKESSEKSDAYVDEIKILEGHIYDIYVYYHNNASSFLNEAGIGISKGTYVRTELSSYVEDEAYCNVFIGSNNALPNEVFDSVRLIGNGDKIPLEYIPGSATIHSFGEVNGLKLSDEIIRDGAPLGYNMLDGNLPGCNIYAGYITFQIHAGDPSPKLNISVGAVNTSVGDVILETNSGEIIKAIVKYTNTSTKPRKNVCISIDLPDGIEYVKGSTIQYNHANPNGTALVDGITNGGINIGEFGPEQSANISFQLKCSSASERHFVKISGDMDDGSISTSNSAYILINGAIENVNPSNKTPSDVTINVHGDNFGNIAGRDVISEEEKAVSETSDNTLAGNFLWPVFAGVMVLLIGFIGKRVYNKYNNRK